MGSASSAPPPPDTSMFSDALSGDADQMRQWAQSMWDSGQEQMQQIGQYATDFMSMSLPAAEEMFQWASTQRERFNEFVMPQMESLFKEAETYASTEEQDRQRGMAVQDIKSATEAQRASQLRKLESFGIDPSDTRYGALDKQAATAEAALSALAANQAGERTKQIGRQLRSEAINVGTGFLTDAQASAVNAANIGATGANVGSQAAHTGIALQQGALPFMQGAGGATRGAAGIVDTSYGRDLDYAIDQRAAESADASGMAGLGKLAGVVLAPMTGGASMVAADAAFGAEGGAVSVLPTTGYAYRGGPVSYADGGEVSGPGGPTDDAGAIRISDGEYIIPQDVVHRVGSNHFDKLIEKETGRAAPSMKMALPVGGM